MNNYKELKKDIIKVVAIVGFIASFIYFVVVEGMYYEIFDVLYTAKPLLGEIYNLLAQAILLYGGIILAPFVVWFYIEKREMLVNKYNELYELDNKKFNNMIIKVWCVGNIVCGLLMEIIAFILLIYEIIDNEVMFKIILLNVLAIIIVPVLLVKVLKIHKEDTKQDNQHNSEEDDKEINEEDNKNKKVKRNYKKFKTTVIILNSIHCMGIFFLANLFAGFSLSEEIDGRMSAREVVKYMEEQHNVDLELEKVIGEGEYIVRLKDNKNVKITVEQFVNAGDEWGLRYDETRLNNNKIGEISSNIEDIICGKNTREYEVKYEEIRDNKYIEISCLIEYEDIEKIVEDINAVKKYSENNPDNFKEFSYYLFSYDDIGQSIQFRIDKDNRLVHINSFEDEIIEIKDDETLEEILRYKYIGMNEDEDGTINQYAHVPQEDAEDYFANKEKYRAEYGEINPSIGER